MIYSVRAQPKVNESHIHEVPRNNGLIFHMGEVTELWCKTITVNNSHVFNLSKCSGVFKSLSVKTTYSISHQK